MLKSGEAKKDGKESGLMIERESSKPRLLLDVETDDAYGFDKANRDYEAKRIDETRDSEAGRDCETGRDDE